MILVLLRSSTTCLALYSAWVYAPLQNVRVFLLMVIPFSVGDVLYVAAGVGLMTVLYKLRSYILHPRQQPQALVRYLLRIVRGAMVLYIVFIMGWGANYYQRPLRETWKLGTDSFVMDTAALRAYDQMLVRRLNELAPGYVALSAAEVNTLSKANYRMLTDARVKQYGIDIKSTLFGYFLERLAIEGYYNPFTGEGQINERLPSFMYPFVVSHEMAHQAGIAAEGDANLLAYALCTASTHTSFSYSGYLNLWLYVNARLYRRDSATAREISAQLNPLTRAHLDTLEQRSGLYNNSASRLSSSMYDSYLKMQQQKGGIKTYGNVTAYAWLLEQKRKTKGHSDLIHIP